ncbi:MAG: RDD family protein [Desulfatitalea sp.]|nr:RDD family protein [Desulfatitalea sp.]NNK00194.1 RDD family protein [Desulfatitalea sp.]
MAWFYKHGDQEVGPVDKSQLQALLKSSTINGQTLVRDEKSDQWRPLAQMAKAKPQAAASPPPVPEAFSSSTPPGPEPESGPQAVSDATVCSQCGRSFPQDQVVRFSDQVICGACKPMVVQRFKEGVRAPGSFRYAGFWIRLGAKIIDTLIMIVAQQAIIIGSTFLIFAATGQDMESKPAPGLMLLLLIPYGFAMCLQLFYATFFLGRYGATLGKMACKIKVVAPEGDRISYARAFGRNFSEMVSGFTLGIGYLMVAWDDEKRALHDRISSTRVVFK